MALYRRGFAELSPKEPEASLTRSCYLASGTSAFAEVEEMAHLRSPAPSEGFSSPGGLGRGRSLLCCGLGRGNARGLVLYVGHHFDKFVKIAMARISQTVNKS
jgi:hypothetical protein